MAGEATPAPIRARSKLWPIVVGVGVSVAAIAGGGALYFTRSGAQPEVQPQKPAPPPPPPSASPRAEDLFKAWVRITPADAELLVDGKATSGTPPYVLEGPPGKAFHVEARRDGYKSVASDVTIEHSDRDINLRLDQVPEEPASRGKVDIFVDPYALVYVDGKKIGQTPRRGLSLPVGSHTVRLINAEHGHPAEHPFEKKIQIRAGKTERLDLDWANDH
jgi:serine/threonine-protein kinase